MKPREEDAPSFRGGFKPNSEALYVPEEYTSCETRALHQTVERYNLVNSFLNSINDPEAREFAEYLLTELIPSCSVHKLSDLDSLLNYINRALQINESAGKPLDISHYQPINDFLAGITEEKEREFAAYIAPKLLGESNEKSEILHLVEFLKTKITAPHVKPD